jgi:sugar phosphate isomerase/epimerase
VAGANIFKGIFMKKGIRGHDVRVDSLADLAEYLDGEGIEYVQLVLERSLTDFKVGSFSEEYAKRIKAELGAAKIAILGSYINPSETDEAALAYEKERFKEKVRFARILEPISVGTETGIYGNSPVTCQSEEAYLHVLSVLTELAGYAKSLGVNIAVEGVSAFVINTPKKMKRLVDDIPYDNVRVIFDPVNYLTRENYTSQREIINEAFELLSDKMVAIHLKDFLPEGEGFIFPDPGQGELDYKLIFENIKRYGVDVPLILEGVDGARASDTFLRLGNIAKEGER